MRYETPNFAVVGDARTIVLGLNPQGFGDDPESPSSTGTLVLGLDD
jgi:hypothetical protein